MQRYDERIYETECDVPILGTYVPFDESTAALCAPLELRHHFRKTSSMDVSLRPRNAKPILDLFSRCRIISSGGKVQAFLSVGNSKEKEAEMKGAAAVQRQLGLESKYEECILWAGKCTDVPNKNMYFWMEGKNVLVRRIMFEWFIGPTTLSQKEKNAFQKRRHRERKKPRQIRSSCSFDQCINPWHLSAKPELPCYKRNCSGVSKETLERILAGLHKPKETIVPQGDSSPHLAYNYEEGESSTESVYAHTDLVPEPEHEAKQEPLFGHRSLFQEIGEEALKSVKEEVLCDQEENAREALLNTNKYSVSILLCETKAREKSGKRKRCTPLLRDLELHDIFKLPRLSTTGFYSMCNTQENI